MAGIHDTAVVDLVAKGPDRTFLLIMVEERPWIDLERQLTQLYEKVNTYLTFVKTGQLVRMYPDAEGENVCFQLRCSMRPFGQVADLIERITNNLGAMGIDFAVDLFKPDFAPHAAVAVMADFNRRWFVAGGWAIDTILGRTTRDHEDVDIAVFRRDQQALRSYLSSWDWQKVVPHTDHSAPETWIEGEQLELPTHELRATKAGYELEFLLNEADGDRWVYRRDPRISLPIDRLYFTVGVSNAPVLAPEVVLFYKAKNPRDRDEKDFAAVLPALDDEQRRWLRTAIGICHPRHDWLGRL